MAHIPIQRRPTSPLLPLLALLALVALGIALMRGCPSTPPVATTGDSTHVNVAGGSWDHDFGLSQTASGVVVRGTVDSEADRQAVLAAVRDVYRGQTVVDSLTVGAGGSSLTGLVSSLPSLVGYLGGVRDAGLGLNGQTLTGRGTVRTQGALDDVTASMRGALPAGYTFLPEFQVVAPPPDVAAADSLIGAALVEPIPFETGTAQLGAAAGAILDRVAAVLTQYPNVRVAVEGHTDDDGEAPANQALSQQRADAAMQYLVGKGIAAARMTAVGYGEARPIASNATAEGKARNRRVVFATDL